MTMEPHGSQAWAFPNLDHNPNMQANFYANNIVNNSATQIISNKPQFIHENFIEKDAIIINSIATTSSIINAEVVDSDLVQNYENIIHENPQIITIHEHNEIITVKDDQFQNISNTSIIEVGKSEIIIEENLKQPYIVEQTTSNKVEIVQLSEINEQQTLKNEIEKHDQKEEQEESLDIVINNVVCCFSTRCHLNLKRIAQEGLNAIYKRDCGVIILNNNF